MANRYLDGERPAPRPAGESPLGDGLGATALPRYRRRSDGCLLARGAGRRCGQFVGAGEQGRRCRAAVGPGQGLEGRRRGGGGAAARRPRRPRRGVPAGRRSPPRRSCPRPAPRVLAQLGYAYPYGPDGNGGPPILDELAWGAPRGRGGTRDRAGAALPAARRRERRRAWTSTRADAPDRQPLPPQRRPLRGRRRPGHRRRPGWPASSGSSSRAGTSPRRERALALRRPLRRGSTPRSGSIRTTPPRSTTPAGPDRRLGRRPAGRRDRRDRPRLRPGLQPDRGPARPTCGGTWRSRSRPGKPAILHCRSADGRRDAQDALRRGAAGGRGRRRRRWAAAFGERPPAVIHSFSGPLDYARRSSTSAWRSASRGSSSGAARRHRPRSPRSSRPTGCSSRPIRRSSPHPARRARATNPSGSASQGRGSPSDGRYDHRGARARPRRRLRPDLPEPSEDTDDPRDRAACPILACGGMLVAAVLAVAACTPGRSASAASPSGRSVRLARPRRHRHRSPTRRAHRRVATKRDRPHRRRPPRSPHDLPGRRAAGQPALGPPRRHDGRHRATTADTLTFVFGTRR